MIKLLIIEDNKDIAGQIKRYLTKFDYEVDIANSYTEAFHKINIDYDLALLDINLPDRDGQYLIKNLKDKDIRVIVITVKDEEDFIVKSLDAGADDYLIKPFSLAILRARIRAVLRTIEVNNNKLIEHNNIKLDLTSSRIYYKGEEVELTALEYGMVKLFMKNPHRVFTRGQLMEIFWEDKGNFVNDNTLTSTIRRIREKTDKSLITTVRGIGYRMD